ncbi:chemotaxis protein CheY [Microbacterium sp. SS28]|uniref:chemotaxis protein CheY n=1 Tax=Microbacterium sp. SS28 TaxID=2919948 RepID=UPI001FA9903B|nr:chemotaxis protein CheY [Microbacterium sp. SS28]
MLDGIRIAWRDIPEGSPRRDTAWRLLRELLPDGAELTNPCPRCGGSHGPVRVSGAPAVVSVTYAGPLAIVAVADTGAVTAIGIDAEPVEDARRDAAGLAGVLGAGAASVRSWTRVEAALKADGRGLRVDPASVRVREHDTRWTAVVPGAEHLQGWDAEGPEGFVVSVAVRVSAAAAPQPDRATRPAGPSAATP